MDSVSTEEIKTVIMDETTVEAASNDEHMGSAENGVAVTEVS